MTDNSTGETFKPEAKVFDDGLETNLISIAEYIFSHQPGKPYSIGLQLDHPVDSGKTSEQTLQEMLTLLLLSGVQIKYGDSITFRDLNSSQKETLREYMWSVGYDPVIHMEQDSFWIEFKPYKV